MLRVTYRDLFCRRNKMYMKYVHSLMSMIETLRPSAVLPEEITQELSKNIPPMPYL